MVKRGGRRLRKCCRPVVLLNIILAAMVISLVVLIARLTHASSDVTSPDHGDDDGKTPGNGTRPPDGTDPSKPGLSHPRNGFCSLKWYTDTMSFDFTNTSTFILTEAMDPQLYMTGGISGTVWIVAAPPDQQADVQVWVSYASTEVLRVTDIDYGYSKDGLKLGFPKLETPERPAARKPCMDVAVGVYVKANVDLDHFKLDTRNLNIEAGHGAAGYSDYFGVSETWEIDESLFKTANGHVKMAYWNTRRTIVESRSGSVTGIFALRDLLSITTLSGQISVEVRPHEASKTNPLPAVFTASAHSGSVHVGYYDKDIPDRDYRTSVETRSGSISGSYNIGTIGSFISQSGSISADLYPYLDSQFSSSLRTETGSSSTSIYVLSPNNDHDDGVMNKLKSVHKSGSGSLNLVYPQEWEGTIEGYTRSGSINAKGKDLKIYYSGAPGGTGKHFVAGKGHGASRIDFTTGSGSVNLKIGDYSDSAKGGSSKPDRDVLLPCAPLATE